MSVAAGTVTTVGVVVPRTTSASDPELPVSSIETAPWRSPRNTVVVSGIIANVDGEPKRTASAAIDALIAQVSSPVRWEDVVRRLASEGVTTYVEVGPGTALSGMVRRINGAATVANVAEPADVQSIEALRV